MKNYRNELYSFEIEIPEEWSLYTGIVANSPLGKDQTLTFTCRRDEAVNIKIAPLMLIPFLYQIESKFRQYAQEQGYTSLELGRFKADGAEHVWVRCYEGDGRWSKQYRIVLHGFEYMITARCTDERLLLEMEKDWDVVASSFSLIKKPDAIAEKSAPEREAQDGSFIENNEGEKVLSKDNLEGVKTYENDELGFEIDMPARWIVPPASTHQPPFDESIIIGCGPNEAFNFQIGPLLQVPTLDFTERKFIEFAQKNKYSDLEFGRINVEGKLHIWARYYMGRGAWTKKYLIVLGGFEYAITATCFNLQEFAKKEKVWDEVVGSFRLSRSKKQDMTEINRHRREVAGKLYEEAYEAVASERYSEARSLLEQCLRGDPDHILAHKELAVVLKKLGDIKGALAHRREVKRLDPSDTVNRYNLADLLFTSGEKNAAMQEIKELQTIEPAKINKVIRFQMGMDHIFQAVSLRESKGGSRAENLMNAIHHYQQALEVLTHQDFPEQWASVQIERGEAYRYLSLIKDLDDNLLQAIFHYEQALEVATCTEYSELWAAAHNNLGIAFANGTRGDVAENVEEAISHCQQALEFYTRDTHPDDWAMTQNNLGNAYRRRVKGNRAENIEQAIFCFHQALEVQDHQVDREQWAGTHSNLTLAYHERLKGEPAENLEKIIFHAQRALEVYTFETHPRDWALMHNRLGATYKDRICGDRADNLEQAIRHVELALKVFRRQTDPEDWAKAQIILGLAYQDRKRGDRGENIEKVISYFLYALQVFTKQAFPTDWAATQVYLAYGYQDRMRGDRAENLERSISYFQQALEVCTREAYPEQWATTHNSLALVYIKRQKGDRSKNYDQALYHCQQQLDVYTRQLYPERWAMAQFFMGTIMIDRKRGDRSEYTEQALHHYQQALEVFTREEYPEEWARVQEGLTLVYKERYPDGKEIKGVPVNLPPNLTYPDFYNEASRQNSDKKRHLKLIHADVPDIKYATSLLLEYQWEADLSNEEADRLKLRAVAYLCCAIYDIARNAGIPCAVSPIPNGQRPAWLIEGERAPVSLTLSDIDVSDRTLQMSIGPIAVSLDKLPVNKVPLRKLMEGFQKQFNDIYV